MDRARSHASSGMRTRCTPSYVLFQLGFAGPESKSFHTRMLRKRYTLSIRNKVVPAEAASLPEFSSALDAEIIMSPSEK